MHVIFSHTSDPTGRAKVIHEFQGSAGDELDLYPGDEVVLLEHVGAEWFKGRLGLREGLFPASFVEVTKAILSL